MPHVLQAHIHWCNKEVKAVFLSTASAGQSLPALTPRDVLGQLPWLDHVWISSL